MHFPRPHTPTDDLVVLASGGGSSTAATDMETGYPSTSIQNDFLDDVFGSSPDASRELRRADLGDPGDVFGMGPGTARELRRSDLGDADDVFGMGPGTARELRWGSRGDAHGEDDGYGGYCATGTNTATAAGVGGGKDGGRGDRILSDVPRVREMQQKAGYREGIAQGKGESVQEGFDKGYAVGAGFGARVGVIVGVLGGVVWGLEKAKSTCGASVGQGEREGDVLREMQDMSVMAEGELGMEVLFNAGVEEAEGAVRVWEERVRGVEERFKIVRVRGRAMDGDGRFGTVGTERERKGDGQVEVEVEVEGGGGREAVKGGVQLLEW